MKGFGWKRKSSILGTSSAFNEDNQHEEVEGEEGGSKDLDWVEISKKRIKLEQPKCSKLTTQEQIERLKQEGISYIERDFPWQAIGRWDEALNIKIPPGSSRKDFSHEKLLDMKAQALMNLHEWEPAIETSKESLIIDPNWWCLHQTLGRIYLGFGQLESAVQSFSRAVHICPDNEELRFEDLDWAFDLWCREKSGNREWKPIKEPEPNSDDSSSEENYMIE